MAKNLEMAYLLDFYGDVLTEKQREVMEQYYNDDLSLSEIAENFGISRQGVRDSIKRAETTIVELEDKLGFAKRYRAMHTAVLELDDLLRELKFQNLNAYHTNDDIQHTCEKMVTVLTQMNESTC